MLPEIWDCITMLLGVIVWLSNARKEPGRVLLCIEKVLLMQNICI